MKSCRLLLPSGGATVAVLYLVSMETQDNLSNKKCLVLTNYTMIRPSDFRVTDHAPALRQSCDCKLIICREFSCNVPIILCPQPTLSLNCIMWVKPFDVRVLLLIGIYNSDGLPARTTGKIRRYRIFGLDNVQSGKKKSVCFTLKMGAVGYTEIRVNFYQTARRSIPEDSKYPKFHKTCFRDSATSYCQEAQLKLLLATPRRQKREYKHSRVYS